MNAPEKYKSLFIIIITMITVNWIFQTRDLRELIIDLIIFVLAYLILFPLLERLFVSMSKSKGKSQKDLGH